MSALPLLVNSTFGLITGGALVWQRRRAGRALA
jgi:hypothetical protein